MREIRAELKPNQDHWRNNAIVVEALKSQSASAEGQANELLVLFEMPKIGSDPVGQGLVLPVRGLCVHRSVGVARMAVSLNGERWPLRCQEARDDVAQVLDDLGYAFTRSAGFSGQLTMTTASPKAGPQSAAQLNEAPLVLEIELDDGQHVRYEATCVNGAGNAQDASVSHDTQSWATDTPIEPHWDDTAGARVLICMATYNPDIAGIRQQIDSIIQQKHGNWHLLINDDCSNPEASRQIQAIASNDPRISFRQNRENVGFYHNFEMALKQVPPSAQFVALADQDDLWYPEKLSRLLDAMQADTSLVYCDMRILNADGSVESDTYWRGRRNNYHDLDVLLVANTVTGAASLFRYELIETLLPFPARIGDAFHDHWIACAAFVRGGLGYVDAPLYDYQQHEASVVGHCDFETPAVTQRLKRAMGMVLRPRFGKSLRHSLSHSRQSALAVHRFECRRIELIASNLRVRCPNMKDSHARALALYGRGARSGFSLLAKHFSIIRRGHSTNDAEIRLGVAYLVDALEHVRHRFTRLRKRKTGRSSQNLLAGQGR